LTRLPLLTVFGHLMVSLALELCAPPAASAMAATAAAATPAARPTISTRRSCVEVLLRI
jgi:hypothetical protein